MRLAALYSLSCGIYLKKNSEVIANLPMAQWALMRACVRPSLVSL